MSDKEREYLYNKAKEIFKPGIKFKNSNLQVVGSDIAFTVPDDAKFVLDMPNKMLIYWEVYGGCCAKTIYYNGEWAEIII